MPTNTTAGTTRWDDVRAAAPELAEAVQARFDEHGLALLATLRRDGSPRITGIEPFFADGELWLGMMSDSLKALDLRRDPRLALHAATVDKEVKAGDAKISGRAIEVHDDETKIAAMASFHEQNGYAPEGVNFHLFKVDVTEMSMLRPASDHLVIESWRVGEPVKRIERRE